MQKSSVSYNGVDHIFGWWYAIAAPSAPAENVSQRTRMLVRKGRFTSLILLLEFLINIPSYFISSDAKLIISLSISMFMLCVGVVLNRMGKTLAAAILVIVVMECGMCFWLISFGFSGGGLSSIELPAVNILLQPVLIAVSLFSPKISLPLGFFNILFIVSFIFFSPKTPELVHYLSIPSLVFVTYFAPITNQLFTTLVSALWVTSAWHAMRHADHQENLGKLAQDLINDPELLTQTHNKLDSIRQRKTSELEERTYETWGW
jgi:hypothetical protein